MPECLENQAARKQIASWDDVSGSFLWTDFAEHQINEGNAFHVHYSVTTAATDDHRTGIAFKTPNTTKYGHLVAMFSASAAAEFIINEAPTLGVPAAGVDLAIKNRNRNSATASVMSSLETVPTVASVSTFTEAEMATATVSAGTELDHVFLAGGNGPFVLPKFVLKANTIYLFYLINTGANANTHSIHLDWCEHTDAA